MGEDNVVASPSLVGGGSPNLNTQSSGAAQPGTRTPGKPEILIDPALRAAGEKAKKATAAKEAAAKETAAKEAAAKEAAIQKLRQVQAQKHAPPPTEASIKALEGKSTADIERMTTYWNSRPDPPAKPEVKSDVKPTEALKPTDPTAKPVAEPPAKPEGKPEAKPTEALKTTDPLAKSAAPPPLPPPEPKPVPTLRIEPTTERKKEELTHPRRDEPTRLTRKDEEQTTLIIHPKGKPDQPRGFFRRSSKRGLFAVGGSLLLTRLARAGSKELTGAAVSRLKESSPPQNSGEQTRAIVAQTAEQVLDLLAQEVSPNKILNRMFSLKQTAGTVAAVGIAGERINRIRNSELSTEAKDRLQIMAILEGSLALTGAKMVAPEAIRAVLATFPPVTKEEAAVYYAKTSTEQVVQTVVRTIQPYVDKVGIVATSAADRTGVTDLIDQVNNKFTWAKDGITERITGKRQEPYEYVAGRTPEGNLIVVQGTKYYKNGKLERLEESRYTKQSLPNEEGIVLTQLGYPETKVFQYTSIGNQSILARTDVYIGGKLARTDVPATYREGESSRKTALAQAGLTKSKNTPS